MDPITIGLLLFMAASFLWGGFMAILGMNTKK